MFFSFDGIDGTGKSTQLSLLAQWLQGRGERVLTCRDPGSSPLGEQIRAILLAESPAGHLHRRSEMFLYMAARAQLVEEVIRPALAADTVVISDRFLLANIVYQGYAGGLDVEEIRRIGQACVAGIEPDCIFLLDMPSERAAARLNRPLDRMEQQGDHFQQRLREGFLAEAARAPQRIHVISAERTIEEVHRDVRAIAAARLDAASGSPTQVPDQ